MRYADDFLMLFQYEEEAVRVLELLRTRLAKYGLEVAEDKTRILPIGRFKGTKEDFDFLEFSWRDITIIMESMETFMRYRDSINM